MPISPNDIYAFVGSVLGLVVLIALGEGIRRLGCPHVHTRRLVHAGVGLFVVFTPDLFTEATLVYVLAVGFVLVNGWMLYHKWPQSLHASGRESWGTVVFPLALLPALYVCWTIDPSRQFVLRTAFLTLALADPVAAWVGTARGKTILLDQEGDKTSLAGSIAFGGVAFLVTSGVLLTLPQGEPLSWTGADVLLVALSVATLSTAAEALGRRGWDNFFIVVAVTAALVVAHEHPVMRWKMVAAVAGGALFTGLTWRLGVLDRAGALAGGLLATTLLLAGPTWLVPGLAFFVLSSALSLLGRGRKQQAQHHYAKSDTTRDAAQVYANGGVAWGMLLVYLVVPNDALYWGFLGAFAAAAADTWATELGVLSPRRPRSLRTGRNVPHGTSGAVSGVGMVAALVGAVTVVAGAAWTGAFGTEWRVPLSVLTACGGGGALVDSLAGALLQAQYYDAHEQAYRETPSASGTSQLAHGWRCITNDRVNWMGTTSGAILAMVAYVLVG